jgi:hypothetical protein
MDTQKSAEVLLAKLEEMRASQGRMKAKAAAGAEAAARLTEIEEDTKRDMEVAINTVRSGLQQAIERRMADILSCDEHRVQSVEASLGREMEDLGKGLRTLLIETRSNSKETLATVEAARHEVHTQLGEDKARVEHRTGRQGRASVVMAPKFDGTASWTAFRRQFETAAEHNGWTRQDKATFLITALRGRVADVLYGIPKGSTYEEILETLEDRFGDRHLAVVSRYELKTRTQRDGESLQDFATAIEQLVHRACPALPEDHTRREAVSAFFDGLADPEIQLHLLPVGERTLGEVLRQALHIQDVLAAVRLQETKRRDASRSECWNCGEPGHFKGTCPNGRKGRQQQPGRSERRKSNTQRDTRRNGQLSGNGRQPNTRGHYRRPRQE